jgi:hypothetical protein
MQYFLGSLIVTLQQFNSAEKAIHLKSTTRELLVELGYNLQLQKKGWC